MSTLKNISLYTIPEFTSLSRKHQAFIIAYLEHQGNGSEAYRQSYNKDAKPNVAGACSSAILKNPKIVACVDKLTKLIAEANDLTLEWVERKIKAIADEGKNDSDRLRALELICKIRGWLKDTQGQAQVAIFSDKVGQAMLDRLGKVIDVEGNIKDTPPTATLDISNQPDTVPESNDSDTAQLICAEPQGTEQTPQGV